MMEKSKSAGNAPQLRSKVAGNQRDPLRFAREAHP
jgi:hypothetical protein